MDTTLHDHAAAINALEPFGSATSGHWRIHRLGDAATYTAETALTDEESAVVVIRHSSFGRGLTASGLAEHLQRLDVALVPAEVAPADAEPVAA